MMSKQQKQTESINSSQTILYLCLSTVLFRIYALPMICWTSGDSTCYFDFTIAGRHEIMQHWIYEEQQYWTHLHWQQTSNRFRLTPARGNSSLFSLYPIDYHSISISPHVCHSTSVIAQNFDSFGGINNSFWLWRRGILWKIHALAPLPLQQGLVVVRFQRFKWEQSGRPEGGSDSCQSLCSSALLLAVLSSPPWAQLACVHAPLRPERHAPATRGQNILSIKSLFPHPY